MAAGGHPFYDLVPSTFMQQGDIFSNVPLIGIPPSKKLIVLHSAADGSVWEPAAGAVDAQAETEADFKDGQSEHIIVSAKRGMALLLTQTCNLDDDGYWLVCPAYVVKSLFL